MPEINKKELGKRIKSIRKNYGETLQVFGARFDPPANRSLVSAWENGRYVPNNERLKAIADLGNMSVESLLHGDTPVFYDVFNEVISEFEFKNSEDKEKAIHNKEKIIKDNLTVLNYFLTLDDYKEKLKTILRVEIISLIRPTRPPEDMVLTDIINQLTEVEFDPLLIRFEDDKDEIIRDFYQGGYTYDTKVVLKEGINPEIYKDIVYVANKSKEAFEEIINKYHINEKEIKKMDYLQLRNSVLDSLNDQDFRKYCYWRAVNENSTLESFFDEVLTQNNLSKEETTYEELKKGTHNILQGVEVPKEWKIPITN